MKKVLVFGTFDGVHEGHKYLFREAKKYGEQLYVVVALDVTVRQVKGREPRFGQQERLRDVATQAEVDEALLGNPGDKYAVIEQVRPDVICLGYDQKIFADRLEEELVARNVSARIVRSAAFHPEKYKSSLLHKKKL